MRLVRSALFAVVAVDVAGIAVTQTFALMPMLYLVYL